MTIKTEKDDYAPPECGDPLCSGHIDETRGACILCGVEEGTKLCSTCEGFGSCHRTCPERGQ